MNRVRLFTRASFGLLTLCVAVFVALFALDRGSAPGSAPDVMRVVTAFIAACLCGLAAWRAQNPLTRCFWVLFALANTCLATGEMLSGIVGMSLRARGSHPSAADVTWLAFYPLAFAGLMRLTTVRARGRIVEAVTALDTFLFSIAGAGLAWEFLMRPTFHSPPGALANVVGIAFPAGDLLLFWALASLMFSSMGRGVPRGTAWVAASLVTTLAADVIFARLSLTSPTAPLVWTDPLWLLSHGLSGVAALVYLDGHAGCAGPPVRQPPTQSTTRTGGIELARTYVPYAAVLAAVILSYNHFVVRGGTGPLEDTVMVLITSLIPILVLARQLLVSVENRRLQASLVEASRALEVRVVERTVQLAAEKDRLDLLNCAAKEISRCAGVQETLDVGVELIVRASHRDAVALAGHDQQGAFHFAGNRSLSELSHSWLKKLLRKFLAANAGTVDSDPISFEAAPTFPEQDRPLPRELSAALVFPLVAKQAMLGVACVARGPDDSGLSKDECDLVQNIGAQLAVALDVAHRYDDARFLADNDALTGLANRRTLMERLEQEVARSERANGYFSLIMMDVDNFKECNDTHGHVVGDRALVATSAALRRAVRAGDTVGRLGGDEFVAILPDTGSAGALQVVERIKRCLADQPVSVSGDVTLSIQVSCGTAVFPIHGADAQELLRVADENMYFVKHHGDRRRSAGERGVSPLEASASRVTILDSLINSIDVRDRYTKKHSDDVAKYAMALATRLGLTPAEVAAARLAGLLHDIGKIGVPDGLLLKPGPLSEKERDLIRQHAETGRLIVRDIPTLREVLDGVGGHHERYDGLGYPDGLKGDDIPMQARILAAADAYVAMTTERVYAPALSPQEAQAELRRVSGTQLDPAVVEELLALLAATTDATQTPPSRISGVDLFDGAVAVSTAPA